MYSLAAVARWRLPDGIAEILPPQAIYLEQIRRRVIDLFASWGYQLVYPPLIEYLDALIAGSNPDLALQTLKFTDQVSGHLLGLRADITPQIARIATNDLVNRKQIDEITDSNSEYLKCSTLSRFCYCGSAVHAKPAHLKAQRILLQAGVELFGHSGFASDFEVIQLMILSLRTIGIKSTLCIELGHTSILRALMEKAQLTEQQQQCLHDIYHRKAVPELVTYLESINVAPEINQVLLQLVHWHGDVSVIEQARPALSAVLGELAVSVLEQLAQLTQQLLVLDPELQFYLDLAECGSYHYHSGVVFSAYTESYSYSLAVGGRYDLTAVVAGNALLPATGFSMDLLQIMQLLATTFTNKGHTGILAPALSSDATLQQMIAKLRHQGETVVVSFMHDTTLEQITQQELEQWHCDRKLLLTKKGWEVS